MLLQEICRVECRWSKKITIIFKNYDFCEYVKFGAISWKKKYFANNSLIKVRISDFFYTQVTHKIVSNHRTANFVSTELIFRYIRIPSQFCGFRAKSSSVT